MQWVRSRVWMICSKSATPSWCPIWATTGWVAQAEVFERLVDFWEPVKWQELGLFDYLEIIKNPMDLTTVKVEVRVSRFHPIEQVWNKAVPRCVWFCLRYAAHLEKLHNIQPSLILICVTCVGWMRSCGYCKAVPKALRGALQPHSISVYALPTTDDV